MTKRVSVTTSGKKMKPRIGITVGEATGVGPELALQCVALPEVMQRCRPVLYGNETVVARIAATVGRDVPESVVSVGSLAADTIEPGKFTASTGLASYQAVASAIDDALSKKIDGIVTGPIQKEAWRLAGVQYPGHTELLADRCEVTEYCMMLTSEQISCVLVTIHVALGDVPGLLSVDSIYRSIRLAAEAMGRRHGRAARVAVCGLNPHAGEGGMFSHAEEEELITPAILRARKLGIEVVGPLPPDTAFTPSIRKQTDVYVCMYHDQGLIPLKALAFDEAVNVTLGLPIVRTSVDHGTALDLAWTGRANHQSMLAAIHLAIDLTDD
ncbi:4-hydroxythreonine-4-phosphate dehydrogenase PdxA [bacterium]|nr:4-hydroxythreonine-4-phosphate dehydrogenase PdxA [bacterium]MDA7907127.1 4-hydroxythreonine-4-phosphate dehydrogenase PdxA [bacterium]MDA7915458.1 4-hydroxythreonine-4-phosphate dehydrogenase PdxA [bacterium]MDB4419511.1 4-hydroxythreonine-4-phosphate dehydrogenase PdxA [bacterium]